MLGRNKLFHLVINVQPISFCILIRSLQDGRQKYYGATLEKVRKLAHCLFGEKRGGSNVPTRNNVIKVLWHKGLVHDGIGLLEGNFTMPSEFHISLSITSMRAPAPSCKFLFASLVPALMRTTFGLKGELPRAAILTWSMISPGFASKFFRHNDQFTYLSRLMGFLHGLPYCLTALFPPLHNVEIS